MPKKHEVTGGASTKSAQGSASEVREWVLAEESGITRLTMRRAEAARAIGVSIGTLDTWIKRRLISAIHMPPRVVLLRREDVLKAMERFIVKARS